MTRRIDEPYLSAWRAFLEAHATLIERIEAALTAAGLPPLSWYDVLWPLYSAPGRRLRMGELAARVLTISRSGVTRLVDRLEAAGLLTRHRTPDDRRGVEIAITPAGTAMLRRMWPVYAGVIEEFFSGVLSREEAAALRDALARVVQGIARSSPGAIPPT